MSTETAHDGTDHGRNIEALARQLRLPECEVGAVYQQTLVRLTATARIRNFLGILAMSTTRTILTQRLTSQALH